MFKALSIAATKASLLCTSNTCPDPLLVLILNSWTESYKPPVFIATTGVDPTKNSCYTIPPGSNLDGIIP